MNLCQLCLAVNRVQSASMVYSSFMASIINGVFMQNKKNHDLTNNRDFALRLCADMDYSVVFVNGNNDTVQSGVDSWSYSCCP